MNARDDFADLRLTIEGLIKRGVSDPTIHMGLECRPGYSRARVQSEIDRLRAPAPAVVPEPTESALKKPRTKGERRPTESDIGEQLAALCCEQYAGRLVVEYAPLKREEDVPWREVNETNGTSTEISSTRKHEIAQALNNGEKLSPGAFAAFRWYVATDPRMHRADLLPTPLVLAHQGGRFHFGLGRDLRADEPGASEILVPRTILPLDTLPPFTSTLLWSEMEPWGLDHVHLECRIGRALLPRKTMTIGVNMDGGGGGKTTLLGAVELAIGPENCVRFNPDDLRGENRARTMRELKGKLLAIADDCGHRALVGIAPVIKEIAGGDRLSGRALYRRPESFWNNVHIEMNFNRPPVFDDHSAAMVRDRVDERIFTRRIRATSQDRTDVLQRWASMAHDLDVWFSWGVVRALEYLETGRWADARSPREKAVIADVVRASECRFLWEHFEADTASFMSWEDIEREHHRWWPDYSHRPPLVHSRFVAAAALSYALVTEKQVQVDGTRRRGVQGVRVAVDERDESEDMAVITGLNSGQSTECTENPTKRGGCIVSMNVETKNKERISTIPPPSDVGFSVHSTQSPEEQNAQRDFESIFPATVESR